ncbi:MAG: hypothetical protein Q8K37_05685, partial [Alphaproteobacteria bacterium]|nr:hypothetical protein [Alphaproteobacteria bacterium]
EQEEEILLARSTIERFRSSPEEIYKLGLSFRDGKWKNLQKLDQLNFALECFKIYLLTNTKNPKVMHNLGNINFRLYEYNCDYLTDSKDKSSFLWRAFNYYFASWAQGLSASKNNIKIIFDRLEKEPKFKSKTPGFYTFFIAFFASLQEKKFESIILKNFANAFVGNPTLSTEIVQQMLERFKNNFESLKMRDFDLFMADFVQTLNLTPEDLEEFLIPGFLLKENNNIALKIQRQTTDRDLVVFVGRSLSWVEEIYKRRFPERNILNVPFSLLNRGYDLDIKTIDDLKMLKMDTEIEHYKSYLDSLGFGVEGDLYKNYNRIILVDFITSGSTLNIFRAILESLNPNLKDKMKAFLCSRYDISRHNFFKFSGVPFEVILLSAEFCSHRSFKYGPSS